MDPHHKTITGRENGETPQHPIIIQRLWTSFMDSILLQRDFTFYPCLFCQCFREGTRCPVKDPRKDPGFTSSMIHAPKDILCNYGYITLYTHEIMYYIYVYIIHKHAGQNMYYVANCVHHPKFTYENRSKHVKVYMEYYINLSSIYICTYTSSKTSIGATHLQKHAHQNGFISPSFLGTNKKKSNHHLECVVNRDPAECKTHMFHSGKKCEEKLNNLPCNQCE